MVLDTDLLLALTVTEADIAGQIQFVTIRQAKSLPLER